MSKTCERCSVHGVFSTCALVISLTFVATIHIPQNLPAKAEHYGINCTTTSIQRSSDILWLASYNGRLAAVWLLLKRDADVHAKDNKDGTPLHDAC
jgi:hypothetical protein